MAFQIDRVVFAWAHLEALANAFASVGLTTDYGGIHTNGATHMATLGFGDGSYLELISVRQPGQQAPVWQRYIATNGGICAWSVAVGDVHRIGDRLRTLGMPVDGPRASIRRRPDGETIESEIAFVGAEGMGSLHPFMITDRTPRENRVRTSESASGCGLAGLDSVVLAVPDVEAAAIEFQRVYGAGEPVDIDADALPGRTVRLHGEPVAITSPASADDWVAGRLRGLRPHPVRLPHPILQHGRLARSASTYRADPVRPPGSRLDRLRDVALASHRHRAGIDRPIQAARCVRRPG